MKPAKGRHQGLDCELSGGKATERELYLEACGELWVDFSLGCDMISLYFTKVILTAVEDVELRMAMNLLGKQSLHVHSVIKLNFLQ